MKLSMKQLVPTSIDEYIAEHKAGRPRVRPRGRRVLGAPWNSAKASAPRAASARSAATCGRSRAQPAKADMSVALRCCKRAGREVRRRRPPGPNLSRPGQIRSFKITRLDADKKTIEVELA